MTVTEIVKNYTGQGGATCDTEYEDPEPDSSQVLAPTTKNQRPIAINQKGGDKLRPYLFLRD
jgi:hypothetical protein